MVCILHIRNSTQYVIVIKIYSNNSIFTLLFIGSIRIFKKILLEMQNDTYYIFRSNGFFRYYGGGESGHHWDIGYNGTARIILLF